LESAVSSAAVVRAAREKSVQSRSAAPSVVDPELIVLGGGIGRAPGFAEDVARELARLSPVVPDIRASALGAHAVLDGCLAVGSDQLWEQVLSSRVAGETL
jgi:hypothetical protein